MDLKMHPSFQQVWGCLIHYWLNVVSSTSNPSASDFVCLLTVHMDNSFCSPIFRFKI